MNFTPGTPDLDRALAALAPLKRNSSKAERVVPCPRAASSAEETTRNGAGDEMTRDAGKQAKPKASKPAKARHRNITVLKASDGALSYRVQFRVRVNGKQISKARSFSTLKTAKAWRDKTRAEIELHGISLPATDVQTVGQAIERRLAVQTHLGRSTRQMLTNIAARPFGEQPVGSLTTEAMIDFAMTLAGEEKQPQTVGGYMTCLSKTLKWASVRGFKIPDGVVGKAMEMLWEDEILARSEARTRRPSLDELDLILSALASNTRQRLPVATLIVFAIFSGRRLGEACRLRWEDLRVEKKMILVRDMKHPRKKKGNDVWCALTDQALQIILSMPRTGELIFPFKPTSIGTAYQRHRDRVEVEDLRFHDLRHEAVSRLFEMGWTAPFVARHSGHKTSSSLDRYEHVEHVGDKFADWPWLERVVEAKGRL